MNPTVQRKERLEALVHLARVSKGWNRAQLAKALGRDPTKLLPESANPKMDYLVSLAEVLEWPVGEVVEAIWSGADSPLAAETPQGETFEALNEELMGAVRRGDYKAVVSLGQRMYRVARSADERAHASVREAAGWDGLGRYQKVLEVVQRGLRQGPMSVRLRLVLQASLANAQYTLWDLTPALGTSEVLARWYASNPPEKQHDWKRVAYVHYVRGNTHRRLMAMEPENLLLHAESAKADLEQSRSSYTRLAGELADPSLLGVANTCRGGLIEVGVELKERSPSEAVALMRSELAASVDLGPTVAGDWIESWGWWCIFASNIAMRHLTGPERQQALKWLLGKALEVADRLDNWSMRERVFTIQFALHDRLSAETGLDLPLTINEEDRSVISATMSRFPSFRPTAWRILETAQVVSGA
ncbi:MAG TPA: hypothetical protein DEB06_09480 [Phycisphaerales bacterium]|nr:hypothetical protein [Phycisphaerales bacterium]